MRSLTASVNLFLAVSFYKLGGVPNPEDLLNETDLREPEPEARFVYLYMLAIAWVLLIPALVIPFVGLNALSNRLGFHIVDAITLRLVFFLGTFCLVGAIDAAWRYTVVERARRRYRSNGRVVDRQVGRLMRIASFDDRTLLLQFAAGLYSAVTLQ